MSHKEKQRIFDAYAVSKGYDNWQDLLVCFAHHIVNSSSADPDYSFLNHFYNICNLVQEEQQKRISENIKMIDLNEGRSDIECFVVDKSSIINPENKIQ